MSEETLGRLAEAQYDLSGSARELTALLPFLDDSALNRLAVRVMEKEGFSALTPLLPFLDDDEMTKIFKRRFDAKGGSNER